MAKNPEFVKFDKVDKSYDGKILVVKDLQLDIEEGEFVTMLGPSGSGKTTCLMMLAGFETHTLQSCKMKSPKSPFYFSNLTLQFYRKTSPFLFLILVQRFIMKWRFWFAFTELENTYNLNLHTNTTMKLVWGLTLQHVHFKKN